MLLYVRCYNVYTNYIEDLRIVCDNVVTLNVQNVFSWRRRKDFFLILLFLRIDVEIEIDK